MDLSERGEGSGRHPWEIARAEAFRRVLSEHGAMHAQRILDVGAGDGWLGERVLDDQGGDAVLTCWDIHYTDADLAESSDRVVRTAVRPEGPFDLALVLDVFEHIDEPRAFVDSDLRPLLPDGTPVLVSVPAQPSLFSEHDRALGHRCRYRRREFHALLDGWLDVVEYGPLFTMLLAPRALAVGFERARNRVGSGGPPAPAGRGVGDWHGGNALTATVTAALGVDAGIGRTALGRRLPGLSEWAFGYVGGSTL